ncbi:unnamed protein product [Prorocentrum cordatum]|uniref:Uncharacterized protein n=1 Tax=Prorocentrum cordatum TaxID=2364126 RepID=A0ABN9V809_9DINO|nr:unnamed protein product [Polarella glacialis]
MTTHHATRSLELRAGVRQRIGNDLKAAALHIGAITDVEAQQFHSINKPGSSARHRIWLTVESGRKSWADIVNGCATESRVLRLDKVIEAKRTLKNSSLFHTDTDHDFGHQACIEYQVDSEEMDRVMESFESVCTTWWSVWARTS